MGVQCHSSLALNEGEYSVSRPGRYISRTKVLESEEDQSQSRLMLMVENIRKYFWVAVYNDVTDAKFN
jgi:hypothetical protein